MGAHKSFEQQLIARFRLAAEKLGYETGLVGKHGNFEAARITCAQIMALAAGRRRLRVSLTLVVDNASKLGTAIGRNAGEKLSTLEVTDGCARQREGL